MEERDLAFELWWFRAGRNAAETSRILAAEHNIHVTDRAIRKWVSEDGWGARADQQLAELAPNTYAGIVTDIIFGAQAGANYLRRVNEGDPTTRINGRVDIGRVTAANSALAKAGFADRVNRDSTGQLAPPTTEPALLIESGDGLSPVKRTERNHERLMERKRAISKNRRQR